MEMDEEKESALKEIDQDQIHSMYMYIQEVTSMKLCIKEEELSGSEDDMGQVGKDQESSQRDENQFSFVKEEDDIDAASCSQTEQPNTSLSSETKAGFKVAQFIESAQDIKLKVENIDKNTETEIDHPVNVTNSLSSGHEESTSYTEQERNTKHDEYLKEDINSKEREIQECVPCEQQTCQDEPLKEEGRCFDNKTGESRGDAHGRKNESYDSTESIGSVCSYCNKTHQRSDSDGQKDLQCLFCSCSFSNDCQLSEHLRSHIRIKPIKFQCPYCKKLFQSNHILINHRQTCTGKKSYKCSYCTSTFSKMIDLKIHRRTHAKEKGKLIAQTKGSTGEGKFQCSCCGKEFEGKSRLIRHMQGKIRHESPYFGKKLTRRIHLNEHVERHAGTQTGDCDSTIAEPSNLAQHMASHSGQQKNLDLQKIKHNAKNYYMYRECSLCMEIFSTSREKDEHMIRKHGQDPCECFHCNKKFSSKYVLNEHVRKCTRESSYQCTICCTTFSVKCSLIQHKKTCHTQKEQGYECPHCNEKFLRKDTLLNHIKMHEGDKPSSCSSCSKTFITKGILQEHMKTHIAEDDQICPYCSKKFSCKSDLNEHVKSHAETKTGNREENLPCSYCDRSFAEASNLAQHMKSHSGERKNWDLQMIKHTAKNDLRECSLWKEIVATSKEKDDQICPYCNKKFSARQLKRHIKRHTTQESYQCAYCSRTFSAKCSLNKHYRTQHKPKGEYECSECNQKFLKKVDLLDHMRTHTGEIPHQCSHCSRNYFTKSGLGRHMKRHTQGLVYECSFCGKKFFQKDNLDDHVRTHTGERPYQCPHCDKRFHSHSSLSSHVRRHTGRTRGPDLECPHCSKKFYGKGSLTAHIRTHREVKPYLL